MNLGTSMCVGQARVHGASKQYRQRAASTRASIGRERRRNVGESFFQEFGRLPVTGPEHGDSLSRRSSPAATLRDRQAHCARAARWTLRASPLVRAAASGPSRSRR